MCTTCMRITRATALAVSGTGLILLSSPASIHGAIWYVDQNSPATSPTGTSWSLAFKFIPQALALANPETNDVVYVAEGTYRPDESPTNPTGTGNRALAFALKKGVAVYGGFLPGDTFEERDPEMNPTYLSGDLDGNDDYTATGFLEEPPDYGSMANNSYRVCTAISTSTEPITDTTVLDGFIVRGGNANGSTDETKRGAGLYCGGADIHDEIDSSPTVAWSRFDFNRTEGGYAAAVYSSYGDAVLRDLCHFENNHSGSCGGAIVVEFGTSENEGLVTVLTSRFVSNRASSRGGAIQIGTVPARAIISSSHFIDNQVSLPEGFGGIGGALYLRGEAEDDSIVLNCVLQGNSAVSQGGAAFLANTDVTNCTIVDNEVTRSSAVGGGITGFSNVVVKNSILWDNSAPGATTLEDAQISGSFSASYSDIQADDDPVPGDENINELPEFKGSTDLRLTSCSPCIDEGDVTGFPADEFDLDDDDDTAEETPDADSSTRVLDGDADTNADVDMGAYEYDPDCPADLYVSGAVNGTDLALLLGAWTGQEVESPCPDEDLTGDCRVNGFDLAIVLGAWGDCGGVCNQEFGPGGGGGSEEEDGGTIAQLVAWYLAGDMAAIIQWLIEQGY